MLYIGPSTFLAFTHRDLVTDLALKARLPTFCATESIVRKARCMFGLFSNGNNIGRFAAFKAAQILVDGVAVDQSRGQKSRPAMARSRCQWR
jgi:putative ABC transport system substrate-binding protein